MAAEAVQLVGPPLIVAVCPAIVTVGVWMLSEEEKVNVTVSPTFAIAMLELLEAMETDVKVGGVVSKVMLVFVTVVAGLPAKSIPLNAKL